MNSWITNWKKIKIKVKQTAEQVLKKRERIDPSESLWLNCPSVILGVNQNENYIHIYMSLQSNREDKKFFCIEGNFSNPFLAVQ